MKQRHWLVWVLLLALGVWVFRRFTDFSSLAVQLGRAEWPWILLAAALHLVYFLPYALLYQAGFRVVEVRSPLRSLVPLIFAAIFANAVMPSGGAAAMALFVDDAERRGESGARAAVGTVLVLLVELISLIPFLTGGLVALALRHDLKFYDLLGSAIYLAYVLGLSGIIVLAAWKEEWLRRLFAWFKRTVNHVGSWFKRPNRLPDDWDRKNADQFSDAAAHVGEHPRELALTFFYGTLVDAISLASLYAIFRAFRQPIGPGPLMAGFSIGIVFWVITIIPHGVAAVEGMMMLVFTSLGIPGTRAAAITLVFRCVNYWLPLALGFFFLRYVRAFGIAESFGGHSDGAGDRDEGLEVRTGKVNGRVGHREQGTGDSSEDRSPTSEP